MKQQIPETWLAVQKQATESFIEKLNIEKTSWSYYRPITVIDLLFSKMQEITKLLEESGTSMTTIGDAYIDMINFGMIGIIQLLHPQQDGETVKVFPVELALQTYTEQINEIDGRIELQGRMTSTHKDIELLGEMIKERLTIVRNSYHRKSINSKNEKEAIIPHFKRVISQSILVKSLLNEMIHG